jgi:hypothetical protein
MTKKEEALFLHLKENFYPDLEFAPETYSKHDCIDGEVLIELKCRNKHYPTMLIEKKKYDYLTETANELGLLPLYVNSTPEGIYKWDLSSVDIEWKVENKHPATTTFHNNRRVEKEVGYLDVEEAEVLE